MAAPRLDRAILLAAGEGRRLRPLTGVLAKCLVPVQGRPLLGIWLDRLASAGIVQVLVNTCHLAEQVERYLDAGRWRCTVRVVREAALRGTGGSLIDFLPFWREEGVVLVHADNLSDVDVGRFVDDHRRHAASPLTLMTYDTTVPRECGIVEQDADGRVTGFHEKVADPPGRRASAALFAIDAALARELPAAQEAIDFSRDLLPRWIGRMHAWHHAGFHRDVGSAERYLSAQWEFPGRVGAADPAWRALLDARQGELRERLAAALAEIARQCGYRPRRFADPGQALRAPQAAGELAIIERAGRRFATDGPSSGLPPRSLVLEVEEGE